MSVIDKHDLVLVEWKDSVQPVPNWMLLDEAPDLDAISCVSVGWIISQNDNVVMLVPNLGDHKDDNAQGCGFIRIPRSAITRIVRLRENVIVK
jgi:hypothetical protein